MVVLEDSSSDNDKEYKGVKYETRSPSSRRPCKRIVNRQSVVDNSSGSEGIDTVVTRYIGIARAKQVFRYIEFSDISSYT